MKKKLRNLITVLFMLILPAGFAQVHSWVRGIEGFPYGYIQGTYYTDITTDNSGNSYVFFYDDDGGSYMGGHLVKYDLNGNTIWSKILESANGVVRPGPIHYTKCGIDIDASGNVYIAGTFCGDTLKLGSGINIAHPMWPWGSYGCPFVAKYDPSGNCLWGVIEDGGLDAMGIDITVCPNGSIYMLSNGWNGTGTTSSSILKYNSSGVFQSAVFGTDWGHAIESDTLNNVYYFGQANWPTTPPEYDNLIYKITPSGSVTTHIQGILKTSDAIYDPENRRFIEEEGASLHVSADGNSIYWTAPSGAGNHSFLYNTGTSPPFWMINAVNNDAYLGVYSSTYGVWCKQIGSAVPGSAMVDVANDVTVDNQGNIFVAGWSAHGPTYFSPTFSLTNSGNEVYSWVAKYSHTGMGSFQTALGGTLAVGKIFNISANNVCGVAFTGRTIGNALFSNDIISDQGVITGTVDMAVATGNVFRDFNNNGVRNPGETGIQGAVIEASPGLSNAISAANGNYVAGLSMGSYTLTIPSPPLYHTLTTASSHPAMIASCNASDTANHFGFYPTPGVNDLRVTLTPMWPSVPGFVNYYKISYKNVGTSALSGSVTLNYDPAYSYLSGFPTASSTSAGSATWNFSSLAPASTGNIAVYFLVDSTVMAGTVLSSTAVISPITSDMAPGDNTSTVNTTVVSSYDPNDKQVEPAGFITPADVASGQWLTYTVRFQNTGTWFATNVYIRDTLSSLVDASTLEVLSSSHAMTYDMFGDGIVNFLFNGIMLPDSSSNEPGSHGFVKFRVKVSNSAMVGNVIENTAHIYFDFNEAVVTNTTLTPVSISTNIQESAKGSIMAYPNPTNERIFISVSDRKVNRIKAYDMQGRFIQEYLPAGSDFFTDQAELDVHKFSPGSYLLQFITEDQENLSSRITIIR